MESQYQRVTCGGNKQLSVDRRCVWLKFFKTSEPEEDFMSKYVFPISFD